MSVFLPFIAIAIMCSLLSGCVGAVVGVGTAAVAASNTEKGLSTSVA
ncbi:MAG: transporter, partial [Bacteroidetes bacterium]|nr:transporter [Bacteroidota bacterium]